MNPREDIDGESTGATPARSARYRVSLAEEATIVERGERRRKWFIRHQGDWLRVAEHPDATLEADDDDSSRCPPGVVWQRRYELKLKRGTRLMAVSSFPKAGGNSTLWYLNHGVVKAEFVWQQQQYIVAGNYRLVERGQMHQRIESKLAAKGAPKS